MLLSVTLDKGLIPKRRNILYFIISMHLEPYVYIGLFITHSLPVPHESTQCQCYVNVMQYLTMSDTTRSVAKLVDQPSCNPKVVGSSPSRATKFFEIHWYFQCQKL